MDGEKYRLGLEKIKLRSDNMLWLKSFFVFNLFFYLFVVKFISFQVRFVSENEVYFIIFSILLWLLKFINNNRYLLKELKVLLKPILFVINLFAFVIIWGTVVKDFLKKYKRKTEKPKEKIIKRNLKEKVGNVPYFLYLTVKVRYF